MVLRSLAAIEEAVGLIETEGIQSYEYDPDKAQNCVALVGGVITWDLQATRARPISSHRRWFSCCDFETKNRHAYSSDATRHPDRPPSSVHP